MAAALGVAAPGAEAGGTSDIDGLPLSHAMLPRRRARRKNQAGPGAQVPGPAFLV